VVIVSRPVLIDGTDFTTAHVVCADPTRAVRQQALTYIRTGKYLYHSPQLLVTTLSADGVTRLVLKATHFIFFLSESDFVLF
jgi:hypothetical protein